VSSPFLAAALLSAGLLIPLPASPATLAESSQLSLRNLRWDAVRVEVRLGTAGDCDLNELAGVRTLQKGQTWAVVSDVPVCWRREATPGALGALWTPWQRPTLTADRPLDVDL
jgi:hypothetical protein